MKKLWPVVMLSVDPPILVTFFSPQKSGLIRCFIDIKPYNGHSQFRFSISVHLVQNQFNGQKTNVYIPFYLMHIKMKKISVYKNRNICF